MCSCTTEFGHLADPENFLEQRILESAIRFQTSVHLFPPLHPLLPPLDLLLPLAVPLPRQLALYTSSAHLISFVSAGRSWLCYLDALAETSNGYLPPTTLSALVN